MPKDRHIKVDLVSNKKQIIEVVQHEHGFTLSFEVLSNSNVVDLSEYNPILLVQARELIQANPISVEGNKVAFNITSNMTNLVTSYENNINSYTPLELVLYKEGEQLSILNMYFKVLKSLTDKTDEAVQADNSFDIIQDLLNAVDNIDEIQSAIKLLENVEDEVNDINDEINNTNEMLQTINNEIDGKLNNVNQRLEVAENDIDKVEDKVVDIEDSINNINLILGDIIGDKDE